MKKNFESVTKSLDIFKEDDLCSLPGSKYLYSTYSYTLLSAVIEGASKKNFSSVMTNLFKRVGMQSTYMDENKPIIYNRTKFYQTNSDGKLVNAPYVDNSNKWAGGGMLSTADDLCQFGTALLYSFQFKDIARTFQSGDQVGSALNPTNSSTTRSHLAVPEPFLKPETVKMMWTAAENTKCGWDEDGGYAMGWCAIPEQEGKGYCGRRVGYFSHTGGAVGASSVLLILPCARIEGNNSAVVESKYAYDDTSLPVGGAIIEDGDGRGECFRKGRPSGVVVALITNMQGVGMNSLALEIANKFINV